MARVLERTGLLSERQSQILRLIAVGKSNKEIARELGLTPGTIKQHVYALFRKLGVRNRTTAVARGAGASLHVDAPPATAVLPDEVSYARRLVTVVVVEPRPEAVRSAREALQLERRCGALRLWVQQLAFAFDADCEALPGGGTAAWFGHPLAHGDDAERAVAFVRALPAGARRHGVACAAGIGTVAEMLGEGERRSVAYRTFRVATLLASLADSGASLACGLTAEVAGLPRVAPARTGTTLAPPEGAVVVGAPPPPSLEVARGWSGLPFVAELAARARGRRCQWVGVESWPPEAGTRLIDAIGECLVAQGFRARSLWMPAAGSGGDVAQRLIRQLHDDAAGEAAGGATLPEAIAQLGAAGPAVLLVQGIDALPNLAALLGAGGLERLRELPLALVAGAMHRTGAPQTVVRLFGSNPAASPFVRVLRMQVPGNGRRMPLGIRPDVQAVLDALSLRARAVARLASNPHSREIGVIALALGMAPDAVLACCGELEASGLASVQEGRLEFRDPTTAAAVRASLE